jgi:iron complex transport system substrate-binding protein
LKNTVRKISIIFSTIILFTALFTSCGGTTTTSTNTTTTTTTITTATTATATTTAPVVINDQIGRTVTLSTTNPQRIVSLSPSTTEILFALGLNDRIAGVTDYCNYPPEAKQKPSVGDYTAPNMEKLIALNPDLILVTEEQENDVLPQLVSKGLTVIGIKPGSVSDVFDSIIMIGTATGKTKEANDIVKDLKERIQRVTAKTENLPDSAKPKVFYIIWHDPLWTVGSNTFHDELIAMAGGVNITHDLSGYVDISLETVIDKNPDIIIAGVGMGDGEEAPFAYAQNEPRLAETAARQKGQVYSVNMDIVSRPGPRLVDALEEFLAIIHPELRDQP